MDETTATTRDSCALCGGRVDAGDAAWTSGHWPGALFCCPAHARRA